MAQITKQGYLFIFDRLTGKPLFDVREVPVENADPIPGEGLVSLTNVQPMRIVELGLRYRF